MKKLLFSSPNCAPCKVLKLEMEELGFLDQYMEIDVTDPASAKLMGYCGIRSVPALIVMSDAEEIQRVRVGYTGNRESLLEFLEDVKQTELERRE